MRIHHKRISLKTLLCCNFLIANDIHVSGIFFLINFALNYSFVLCLSKSYVSLMILTHKWTRGDIFYKHNCFCWDHFINAGSAFLYFDIWPFSGQAVQLQTVQVLCFACQTDAGFWYSSHTDYIFSNESFYKMKTVYTGTVTGTHNMHKILSRVYYKVFKLK